MTNMSFPTTDLQRKSGEITDAVAAGHTVTLTRYRKPFAQITPARSAAVVPADLLGAVEAYAAAQGVEAAAALRSLIEAGLAAGASAERTMWDVFPEADRAATTGEALSELIQGESTGDGEAVEYEWDGRHAQHYYSQVRGQWFYEFSERTDEKDARGHDRWDYTWTLCGSREEAKGLYREAIIAASAAWRPEEGRPMWGDAWAETFDEFEADGAIPHGSFDSDAAEAAADAIRYPED
jgi:antitoxin (DNA-binding transcriptional repressor) of toxin-antitoxin stability system